MDGCAPPTPLLAALNFGGRSCVPLLPLFRAVAVVAVVEHAPHAQTGQTEPRHLHMAGAHMEVTQTGRNYAS